MLLAARAITDHRSASFLYRFHTSGQNVHRELFSNFFDINHDYFTVANHHSSNFSEPNRIFAFEIKDRIFPFIHYIFFTVIVRLVLLVCKCSSCFLNLFLLFFFFCSVSLFSLFFRLPKKLEGFFFIK